MLEVKTEAHWYSLRHKCWYVFKVYISLDVLMWKYTGWWSRTPPHGLVFLCAHPDVNGFEVTAEHARWLTDVDHPMAALDALRDALNDRGN